MKQGRDREALGKNHSSRPGGTRSVCMPQIAPVVTQNPQAYAQAVCLRILLLSLDEMVVLRSISNCFVLRFV